MQASSGMNDTIFNQVDRNGLKQGYWKKYYSNGKLKYYGLFKDDKPAGEMRRYFESGNIKALMNFDTVRDYSEIEMFYENGSLAAHGYYSRSEKDSLWIYYSYYEKTLISDETYDNGSKNGLSHKYYSNGNITEKTEWKHDIKNGTWEQYFPDNSIRLKGQYINGKLSGDYFVYYPNGHVQVSGYYREDKRHGKWIFYDENDSVKLKLGYNYGRIENKEALTDKQQEFFKNIDNNMNKFNEPAPEDFFPSGQGENQY